MNVAFVSTYPPAPCGIGEYTHHLRTAVEQAAPDLRVSVVAERHPQATAERHAHVARHWRRGTAWDQDAAEAVRRLAPEVVHVQHEEAILGQDGRLIRFLQAVGAMGVRRVVTLHSVYGGRLGLPFWWPPPLFHRAIARNVEAIVVHQHQGGRDFLERQGVPPALIHVLPHGTVAPPGVDRSVARNQLGIPLEDRVALFFGVIHPKKNVQTVVAAAQRAHESVPHFRLLVTGSGRRRTVLDRLYTARLERQMQPGITSGWLDYRPGFLPDDKVTAVLAAADLVLFPYNQGYGSASGVFHLALAAGRATVCSLSPKFGEAREIFARRLPGAFVPAKDSAAWARALTELLNRPDVIAEGEALARAAAAATSWTSLGPRYAELYRSVAATAPRAPAHAASVG